MDDKEDVGPMEQLEVDDNIIFPISHTPRIHHVPCSNHSLPMFYITFTICTTLNIDNMAYWEYKVYVDYSEHV